MRRTRFIAQGVTKSGEPQGERLSLSAAVSQAKELVSADPSLIQPPEA